MLKGNLRWAGLIFPVFLLMASSFSGTSGCGGGSGRAPVVVVVGRMLVRLSQLVDFSLASPDAGICTETGTRQVTGTFDPPDAISTSFDLGMAFNNCSDETGSSFSGEIDVQGTRSPTTTVIITDYDFRGTAGNDDLVTSVEDLDSTDSDEGDRCVIDVSDLTVTDNGIVCLMNGSLTANCMRGGSGSIVHCNLVSFECRDISEAPFGLDNEGTCTCEGACS